MNDKTLPPNSKTASIVEGDTVAQALWKSIESNATYAKALAIPPTTATQKTAPGTCWWTENGCTSPSISFLPDDHKTCNSPSTWGVSIDDGPLPQHCHFYDVLKDNDVAPSLYYVRAMRGPA